MQSLPFIMWALTFVLAVIIYVAVAKAIEKSGLARLGATGKLFDCNSDPAKVEAEMKAIEELIK